MEYQLIDSNGNTYSLNGSLVPSVSGRSMARASDIFLFEQKIVERSFLPGAAKVGDPRIQSRGFVFNSDFAFQTDATFDAYMNELLSELGKASVLRDLTNEKDTKIAITEMTIEYQPGSIKRSGVVRITMTMLDAFWTSTAPVTTTEALSIGENSIAINNTGFLKTYPLLTFTVPNPAESLDIFIDETKEGLQLLDDTLGNVTLTELIIDCVNGSLTIAGFDRTQNITDRTGYFPFPIGESTLIIDIPVAASVEISYYKRFYI